MSAPATTSKKRSARTTARKQSAQPDRALRSESAFDRAVLSIPADHCYWAILRDLPNRADDEARRYAFEPWLPAPLECVETRFARFGDCVIACGVDQDMLRSWIEDHESRGRRVESVVPAAIPDCIGAQRITSNKTPPERLLRQLEYRSGALESPRRRRRRRIAGAALVVALVISSALSSAGFVRRARSAANAEIAAIKAVDRLVAGVLGASSSASVDASLRLAAEVRRLESTRDRSASGLIADDAGLTLASLLASWPESVRTQIDSIRVDPDLITIRGRVPDATSAESLALVIESGLIGWTAQSSSVNKGREGYDFSLALSAQHEGSSP